MRLLPRTPRKTLLAGFAWAVGCLLLWLALPVRPRAQWADDGVKVSIGFSPARRAFVTHSFRSDDVKPSAGGNCGPLRFWEADTGRVTTWFDSDEALGWSNLSPDGQWVALHHGRGGSFRFQLLDTANGNALCDLPLHDGQSYPRGPQFSPDSRWLAYSEDFSGHDQCVHVWDITAQKERCLLRVADGLLPFKVFHSVGFSPDGRTLAIGPIGWTRLGATAQQVQFWDMDTARLIRTLPGPTAEGCGFLRFSATGSHLAATFVDWAPHESPSQVCCWDVQTGAKQFQVEDAILASSEGNSLWLVKPRGSMSYEARTFTGIVEHVPVIQGGVAESATGSFTHGLAPNGKTLWVSSRFSDPLADWVAAQGLRWPFPRRDGFQVRFVGARSGKVIGYLPPNLEELTYGFTQYGTYFSPDGALLLVADNRGLIIWDVPPRKPLTWFLAGAALWALPLVLLTRRTRRIDRQRDMSANERRTRGPYISSNSS